MESGFQHQFRRSPRLSGRGFTVVEVMIAFLVLGLVLLPVFWFLTNAMKETEQFYCEAVAISRAKFVMDALMFQIPWRVIRAGNPCTFDDPKKVPAVGSLLAAAIPLMFEAEYAGTAPGTYKGEGLIKDAKGFLYRIRVRCVDVENLEFKIGGKTFQSKELTAKDADGKFTLIKQLVLQVKWSLTKGVDPLTDPRAKSLFLTGYKADLER